MERLVKEIKAMANKMLGNNPDDGSDEIERVLTHVRDNATERDTKLVLSVIESYGDGIRREKHLEKEQGSVLEVELKKIHDPRILALELGTHCGYSAIKIASTIEKLPGSNRSVGIRGYLISLDTRTVGIAQNVIKHAGISSELKVSIGEISGQVTLLKGTLREMADVLRNLVKKMEFPHFNFIFMNHSRNTYLEDLKFLEHNRMLGKGTTIVANTKGFPQDHEYFEYLNNHQVLKTSHEFDVVGMTVSTWI